MNWLVLKALNNLYNGLTLTLNATLNADPEIFYLSRSRKALKIAGSKIFALPKFGYLYEKDYKVKFLFYHAFLERYDLLKPQLRIEEKDIKILMNVAQLYEAGDLESLRAQIIAADESLRGISEMFFRDEKYLDNKEALVKALKNILNVETFANEKDQQYIYKLECHNPRIIVLCENLDFLMKPVKPRLLGIELWYAGGKNVNKLEFADTRGLPVYYSCDWDYDGMFIIYPMVKRLLPNTQLLIPDGEPKGIVASDHNSKWQLSSRTVADLELSVTGKQLLHKLIQKNAWITEESNSLVNMTVNLLSI
ncbi:hypothetical protein CLV51_10546 [Chitinophaga niastensis]|uniref:Wadjet protein JetD C-terminal domain-containing protein n=1 Tax=Chitinophaga niastensis TaxID=536980 RepID=A0A2P8HEQ8_CHINA|nr:hypothetical protein [Chitinophaga niastensis]PSL44674.1 hypothetical protein CLV51_10546 [Chitinophaga niastensis]